MRFPKDFESEDFLEALSDLFCVSSTYYFVYIVTEKIWDDIAIQFGLEKIKIFRGDQLAVCSESNSTSCISFANNALQASNKYLLLI